MFTIKADAKYISQCEELTKILGDKIMFFQWNKSEIMSFLIVFMHECSTLMEIDKEIFNEYLQTMKNKYEKDGYNAE